MVRLWVSGKFIISIFVFRLDITSELWLITWPWRRAYWTTLAEVFFFLLLLVLTGTKLGLPHIS